MEDMKSLRAGVRARREYEREMGVRREKMEEDREGKREGKVGEEKGDTEFVGGGRVRVKGEDIPKGGRGRGKKGVRFVEEEGEEGKGGF